MDGRRVEVSPPEGVSCCVTISVDTGANEQIVQPGQETKIVGEGMPISKASSPKRKGDLIVRWNVVFPSRITPAQRQELRKVLN